MGRAGTGSAVHGYIIYRDYIELTEFEKICDYRSRDNGLICIYNL